MNTTPFGSWELCRKGHAGKLEFRKINGDARKKKKNFIVLGRKNNGFHDFMLCKNSAGKSHTVKAQFQDIGNNEIHVYFDNYKDVILKTKKNGKILEVIDITNGLGLR